MLPDAISEMPDSKWSIVQTDCHNRQAVGQYVYVYIMMIVQLVLVALHRVCLEEIKQYKNTEEYRIEFYDCEVDASSSFFANSLPCGKLCKITVINNKF